jgi:hypothetical protein
MSIQRLTLADQPGYQLAEALTAAVQMRVTELHIAFGTGYSRLEIYGLACQLLRDCVVRPIDNAERRIAALASWAKLPLVIVALDKAVLVAWLEHTGQEPAPASHDGTYTLPDRRPTPDGQTA